MLFRTVSRIAFTRFIRKIITPPIVSNFGIGYMRIGSTFIVS